MAQNDWQSFALASVMAYVTASLISLTGWPSPPLFRHPFLRALLTARHVSVGNSRPTEGSGYGVIVVVSPLIADGRRFWTLARPKIKRERGKVKTRKPSSTSRRYHYGRAWIFIPAAILSTRVSTPLAFKKKKRKPDRERNTETVLLAFDIFASRLVARGVTDELMGNQPGIRRHIGFGAGRPATTAGGRYRICARDTRIYIRVKLNHIAERRQRPRSLICIKNRYCAGPGRLLSLPFCNISGRAAQSS